MAEIKSPFHPGERQIQARYGVRYKVEHVGRRVIRDWMPDQHRELYEKLPIIFVGSEDVSGQPWASILWGQPGFIQTPNARSLHIQAPPAPGDALHQNGKVGASIALLGLEFHTRRRNRLNGHITACSTNGGIQIDVDQSFGNCPKYIQARTLTFSETPREPMTSVESTTAFTPSMKQMISRADTFIIASTFQGDDSCETDPAAAGLDVSHRGGRPGFVTVQADNRFYWPDYSGNNHYNTLGNLALDPRSGYLFLDFENGDLLQVVGRTDILWDAENMPPGAERLLRFTLERAVFMPAAMPIQWSLPKFSPFLPAESRTNKNTQSLVVARIERESDRVRSFYFTSPDGSALPEFKPGQFIQLQLPSNDGGKVLKRNYSLSDKSGRNYWRISVKRQAAPGGRPDLPPGRVSNFLHDHLKEGMRLDAIGPLGSFTAREILEKPQVLIAAGVGITPLLAMLEAMAEEETQQPVHLFYGVRDGNEHAFAKRISNLISARPNFRVIHAFSKPLPEDRQYSRFDVTGRITPELVERELRSTDGHFYICGPDTFMKEHKAALVERGAAKDHIHMESFGSVKLANRKSARHTGAAQVQFASSGKTVTWQPEAGTLMELAEEQGLTPAFDCRVGACGTCATKILAGKVRYPDGAVLDPPDGEALICSALPDGPVKLEL